MRNHSAILKTFLLMVLLLLRQELTAAAVVYEIVSIGGLVRPTDESYPSDINNRGQVVGRARVGISEHAFLWEAGQPIRDLGTLPGFAGSEAMAINERGDVVGVSGDNDGRAFLWTESAGMQQLASRPGATGRTVALDINDSGQIAGVEGVFNTALLWTNPESVQALAPNSIAYGINNNGVVVGRDETGGSRALGFVWQAGAFTHLPMGGNSNADQGNPQAINDAGIIAGDVRHGFYDHKAAYWTADRQVVVVGDLPGGSINGYFNDINNHNVAAGYSQSDGNQQYAAFVWDAQSGLQRLNDMLHPESQGWDLRIAYALNDRGQIVGWGRDPNGRTAGWIATPVPEPGAILLALVALVCMKWFRFAPRS
jgi:probable HAF family extracellular repeat protein